MNCAWCDRPNAAVRPLMSKEHPACGICYCIWYDGPPATPQQLRELSLGETGERWLHDNTGANALGLPIAGAGEV